MRNRILLAAIGLWLAGSGQIAGQSRQSFVLDRFEQYLDALRKQAQIPGLSAAIVQDGKIAWERGLGFQDLANHIVATPDTPFPVSGLTQTFTTTLLLQCVEQGKLGLDDRIDRFTLAIPEAGATVRHVLSHTSKGVPGAAFKYDPTRFDTLTSVVEACTGKPYRQALAVTLLDFLAMRDSVPGQDLENPSPALFAMFDPETLDRYSRVLRRLALPYKSDRSGDPVLSDYPPKAISASAGLISTVRDLANYDAALGAGLVLRAETLPLAWTPAFSADRRPMPHGLGWFVQSYKGEQIVWQFGVAAESFSSLILKLPARGLTLILLANSQGLTAHFPLADGDVTSSLFAALFLRLFV